MADIEAFLDNRRMLIVLDSCERMVGAIAELIETVLAFAPNAVILATSREPLRTEGERIRRLDPLLVPPANEPLNAPEALSYASVKLFVDRASSSYPNFRLGQLHWRAWLRCNIVTENHWFNKAITLAHNGCDVRTC
jgi:predicted ATPase